MTVIPLDPPQGGDTAALERRWLGLPEAHVTAELFDTVNRQGWMIVIYRFGPGRLVQRILEFLGVFLAAFVALTILHRPDRTRQGGRGPTA